MTNDAGAILVLKEQDDTRGDSLDEATVDRDDAGLRTIEGSRYGSRRAIL